jgi:hypothetical protein
MSRRAYYDALVAITKTLNTGSLFRAVGKLSGSLPRKKTGAVTARAAEESMIFYHRTDAAERAEGPPIKHRGTFSPTSQRRKRSGPRKPLPHRKVFERNPGPASLTNYCSET